MEFTCIKCGFRTDKPVLRCPKCGTILHAVHDFEWVIDEKKYGIWRFWRMLPKIKIHNSLGEGFTPLIESVYLEKMLGLKLYFKDEGRNPTGSFRDRVAALLTSHASMAGYEKLVCATDGNTGASLAAYAARLGLKVIAYVPRDADYSKIVFMKSLGAEVVQKGERLDDVYSFVNNIAVRDKKIYNATSEANPLSIEALKTIAFEIFRDLGDNVNTVVLPVGSGLTMYSIYHGFKELYKNNLMKKIPRIIGVTHCSNTEVLSITGMDVEECSEKPVIGLSYSFPPFAKEVVKVVKETRGLIIPVTLKDLLRAGEVMARREGLFIEPSAASAIAGLMKVPRNILRRGENVVVIITGHGLKGYEQYFGIKKKERTRVFYRDTKTEIIKLLKEQEGLHGYAIWKNLKIRITLQAVYQHLHELEKKGVVYSKEEEGKKLYYLSGKGKRVAELLDEIDTLLSI